MTPEMLIDGAWRGAGSASTIPVLDKYSSAEIARIPEASESDV